jgi:hypothetical protein
LLSDLPMNAQVGPSERNAVSFRVVPFKNDIRAIHRHHEAGAVETIRNKTRITYGNRTNGRSASRPNCCGRYSLFRTIPCEIKLRTNAAKNSKPRRGALPASNKF